MYISMNVCTYIYMYIHVFYMTANCKKFDRCSNKTRNRLIDDFEWFKNSSFKRNSGKSKYLIELDNALEINVGCRLIYNKNIVKQLGVLVDI